MRNFRIATMLIVSLAVFLGLASSATAEEKKFKIQSSELSISAGQAGNVTFTVKPAKGFKWNKDFPAMLKLQPSGDAVGLKTTEFRGDSFKQAEKETSVSAQVEGKVAGNGTVSGELRFSVCDEESCIIATEKVEAKVTVK